MRDGPPAAEARGNPASAAEGVTAFLEKRAPEWKMSKSRDLPDGLPDLD